MLMFKFFLDDENDPVLKVKLKVRKLKTLDDLTSIPSEEALADDFEEVNQDPAWQKLEEELGRGLENAGVGGTGGTLEIYSREFRK